MYTHPKPHSTQNALTQYITQCLRHDTKEPARDFFHHGAFGGGGEAPLPVCAAGGVKKLTGCKAGV